MKKIFKYFIVLAILMLPVMIYAFDFRVGEQPSVGKEEKVDNDVYMFGGSVNSIGKIKGDLIAGGGNIIINGDVGADILVGGGNVNILSNIGDDVRVGGGTIIIQGRVGGDVVVGGGQVNLSGPGIGGDAVIGGGTVRIDSPVAGDLSVGGGNVYINSLIGGDVKIEADKVTLGSSAIISGDFNYKAKSELTKEEGAVIKGKISFEPIQKRKITATLFAALFSGFFLLKFLALLACALIVSFILRRYSNEIVISATQKPLFELGRGVIAFIVMPIASILLLVTMVGIPFGVVGLLGFVVLILFAWIMTPIILGSFIYHYFSKKELEVSWKTVLIGVLVYTLLSFIPFIGWPIQLLLMLLSLGSIASLKLRVLKEWR